MHGHFLPFSLERSEPGLKTEDNHFLPCYLMLNRRVSHRVAYRYVCIMDVLAGGLMQEEPGFPLPPMAKSINQSNS